MISLKSLRALKQKRKNIPIAVKWLTGDFESFKKIAENK